MSPASRRIGRVLASPTLIPLWALRVFLRALGAALLACTLPACTVIRVGPEGYPTYGHTIDNLGRTGGAFQEPGVPGRAFYNNGLQVLGNVPGFGSVITGGNDAGISIGYLFTLNSQTNTLTSARGLAVVNNETQFLPGPSYTQPTGINSWNLICGNTNVVNTSRVVPSVWLPEGIGWRFPTALPIDADVLGGGATHVGDDGSVYGFVRNADRKMVPYRWILLGALYIGVAMPLPETFDQGIVYSGNLQGQAVGSVWSETNPPVGAHWHNRGVDTVRPLPGHNTLQLFDINSLDVAVGRSGVVGGQFVAVIFLDGKLYNPNSLLSNNPDWFLRSARKVNDANEFTGDGSFKGKDQAYIAAAQPARTPTADQTAGFLNRINQLRQDVVKIEQAGSGSVPFFPGNVRKDLEIAAQRVEKDPMAAANLLQSNANWIRALQNSRVPGSRRDGELLRDVGDGASNLAADIIAAAN